MTSPPEGESVLTFKRGPHGCKRCAQDHSVHLGPSEACPIEALPEWLQPIRPGERCTTCRDCHASIIWRTAPWGRRHPVDIRGGSHFADCPAANARRGTGRRLGAD